MGFDSRVGVWEVQKATVDARRESGVVPARVQTEIKEPSCHSKKHNVERNLKPSCAYHALAASKAVSETQTNDILRQKQKG
jgi:hypothetical protein